VYRYVSVSGYVDAYVCVCAYLRVFLSVSLRSVPGLCLGLSRYLCLCLCQCLCICQCLCLGLGLYLRLWSRSMSAR
jgi:hypothetical protein